MTLQKHRFILLGASLLLALPAVAASISAATAKGNVEKWLSMRTAFKPAATSKNAATDVRTVTNAKSAALFHVVKLEGGGFVIAAADDALSPVIAFSGNGNLVEDERNPLWAILNRDVPQRLRAAAFSGGRVSSRAATVSKGVSEKGRKDSVDDMRVKPLLASQWNQSTVAGKSVYDYYVPAGTPCGCVATAAAQVMRYHEFPKTAVAQKKYPCKVNGKAATLATIGGVYDWSLMPLVPDASISDAECEMIGRLTYDVGVASRMSYASDGSGTVAYYTEKALKDLFHYGQAVYAGQFDMMGQVGNTLLANIDAGFPVMMGISGRVGGHEIVGDGYGYIDDALYVHLNLGWAGNSDAWYNLPDIDTSDGTYTLFDDIVYNIFPEDALEIVSGRVFGTDGKPITNATVYARDNLNQPVAAATTSETGVYALRLPANSTFSVHAAIGTLAGQATSVTTGESRTYSTPNDISETHAPTFAASIGNRWGTDLTVNAGICTVPSFSWDSCSFVDAIVITCSQPDPEATVHYTTDGSDPTSESKTWPAEGLTVRCTTRVKARTIRKGMTDSAIASATFMDRPQPVLQDDGMLVWSKAVGASCYRVYKSSNRFGTETEACSPWMAETSFQTQAPSSAEETVFYFVRAASRPDDDFASPLSDAVARTTPRDSDAGADTQVFTFVDAAGGSNTVFQTAAFPIKIPYVYYTTAGSFGADGFFKVNVPTTSKKDISIPENSTNGFIKTTKIVSSAKFGAANGGVRIGANAESGSPRSWRASLWFVQDGATNYVGRNEIVASPVCFHYFQQCGPSLSLDRESVSVAGASTNGVVNVACAREHEWDVASDVSWLTPLRPHGRGPCAVRFLVDANPGDSPRTATVTVTCGTEVRSVVVTQDKHDETSSANVAFAIASQGTKNTSVLLHWGAVAGATAYEIWRSNLSDPQIAGTPYWVSTNPIPALIDFGAEPGVAYHYRITAVTADGRTEPSPEAIGWAATTVSPDRASVAFGSTNGTVRIVVRSNAGWSALTDSQWVALDAIDTERNGVLDITAEENAGASPRTATITLVGGSSTAFPSTNVIVVTQSAGLSDAIGGAGAGGARPAASDGIPADPTAKAVMDFRDGAPRVSWTSDLPPEEQAKRTYTLWGCKSLDADSGWMPLADLDEDSFRAMRFFKVTATWK